MSAHAFISLSTFFPAIPQTMHSPGVAHFLNLGIGKTPKKTKMLNLGKSIKNRLDTIQYRFPTTKM